MITRSPIETRLLKAVEQIAGEMPVRPTGWPELRPSCLRCDVVSDKIPFPHDTDCPILICSNACVDVREMETREARR